MMFGLDVKSVIVGILLAMFVIPWATSLVNRPRQPVAA